LPLVYDELRKLAAHKLAQEKPGQTLQAQRRARRQGTDRARRERFVKASGEGVRSLPLYPDRLRNEASGLAQPRGHFIRRYSNSSGVSKSLRSGGVFQVAWLAT
jgi:hypothetical protein